MRLLHVPVLFALTATALAQAEPEQSQVLPLHIDSGFVANTAAAAAARGLPAVVWSTVVTAPLGSSWLRLRYGGTLLAGSREPGRDGSFLRLTSLRDGAVQTQHLLHVDQWQDTSAYFNGDAVLVELLAHPGTGANRLQLREVVAGPALPAFAYTICGPTDDRVLSSDARTARNQPGGCTSWMISDCQHCFLTAGHCSSGLQVIQFNVPLSTASGGLQHPPPSDQYAVDNASRQTNNGGAGIGDDWTYFGVFPNSTTSLTPFQANGGQSFDLLSVPPPVSGQNIRITGYGTTSAPVSPTWNQVQKTHAGPYFSFTGSTVRYTTDTTGGNSGSPVIIDGTNQAIAIHTHGGCTSTGGSNASTGSNHPGLQAALANPLGVCLCPALTFSFPTGQPTTILPNGTSTIRVQVGGPVGLQPGTLQAHVTTTAGSQTLSPVAAGPGLFDFTMPAALCGTAVRYWFSAQSTNAVTYTSPSAAPAAMHTTVAGDGVTALRNYNFNTAPPGWTVVNTALTTGSWVRTTPTDPLGPPADFDGSGQCWVTGNGNQEDVDGGPTRLVTETIDLTTAIDPIVSYALWFTNDDTDDRLVVEASNNGGIIWVAVANLGPFTGWTTHQVRVRDLFVAPGQFVLRFSTADQPNNSLTEAALDAFRIDDVLCTPASWASYGAGCTAPGSAPALQLVSLPVIGGTLALAVNGLGSGLPLLIVGLDDENLPLPLPQFAPGCTLLARGDLVVLLVPAGGSAPWSLAIPSSPSLAGVRLHQQALELGTPWTMSAGGVAEIH